MENCAIFYFSILHCLSTCNSYFFFFASLFSEFHSSHTCVIFYYVFKLWCFCIAQLLCVRVVLFLYFLCNYLELTLFWFDSTMDRFLCKYSLLMKFLCIHYVYTESEYIYLDVCACMGARVFLAFQPLLLCTISLFSFFGRRHNMVTHFSFCSPSLCYTLFSVCFSTARNIVFIHCMCVPFAIVFSFVSRLPSFLQICLCERSLLSFVWVCVESNKNGCSIISILLFYPMCILISQLLFLNCMSFHAQKYIQAQTLTSSI